MPSPITLGSNTLTYKAQLLFSYGKDSGGEYISLLLSFCNKAHVVAPSSYHGMACSYSQKIQMCVSFFMTDEENFEKLREIEEENELLLLY